MTRAAVIGTGHYVPDRVVTNDELTRWMNTSDEWITQRSGIRERRWVETDADGKVTETGAEMGAKAARAARPRWPRRRSIWSSTPP